MPQEGQLLHSNALVIASPNHSNTISDPLVLLSGSALLARTSLFNLKELRVSKEESLWTIKIRNVCHQPNAQGITVIPSEFNHARNLTSVLVYIAHFQVISYVLHGRAFHPRLT